MRHRAPAPARWRSRRQAPPPDTPRPTSQVADPQPRERLAQHVVGGILAPGFTPDPLRFVALAGDPQHLAQVRRDLGVGPRLVGAAQQPKRLVAVADAVLDPAEAVGDEWLARRDDSHEEKR